MTPGIQAARGPAVHVGFVDLSGGQGLYGQVEARTSAQGISSVGSPCRTGGNEVRRGSDSSTDPADGGGSGLWKDMAQAAGRR
jgi:hypothetical protein